MPSRREPPTDYGSVLWALAGVWLLTERVCFVGVLCSSRRGTAAVFHVLSNTHIQLKHIKAPHMCVTGVCRYQGDAFLISRRVLARSQPWRVSDCTGSPPAWDWAFSVGLTLEVHWARSDQSRCAVQARLSPSSWAPGAPVRGSSCFATPTMRLPVFGSSPVCAHRSSALYLPMPSLLLQRYSTSTATASWRARSPMLPMKIGALHRRCARLGPTGRI